METRVDEIASRVYRLFTYVTSGAGLTFNQFLIDADEPLLFACGQRSLFASVSAAAARVVSLDRLRWISSRLLRCAPPPRHGRLRPRCAAARSSV